jgi:hypothetical protein
VEKLENEDAEEVDAQDVSQIVEAGTQDTMPDNLLGNTTTTTPVQQQNTLPGNDETVDDGHHTPDSFLVSTAGPNDVQDHQQNTTPSQQDV